MKDHLLEEMIERVQIESGNFFECVPLADGKERTEDEFRVLLDTAGLKLNHIIPTKSPMKIVEATL